ncbi:hypothetical protein F4703DRAFT_1821516 [Phycomyces blakesleeanus]
MYLYWCFFPPLKAIIKLYHYLPKYQFSVFLSFCLDGLIFLKIICYNVLTIFCAHYICIIGIINVSILIIPQHPNLLR